MSNLSWCGLNNKGNLLNIDDICPNPNCKCQKQITFTASYFQLEWAGFEPTDYIQIGMISFFVTVIRFRVKTQKNRWVFFWTHFLLKDNTWSTMFIVPQSDRYINSSKIRYTKLRYSINDITPRFDKTLKQSMVDKKSLWKKS